MLERPSEGRPARTSAETPQRSARYAPADGAREEDAEPVGRAVGDREGDVRVQHVVDQRDVLVPDPLDVVLAEAVAQHRRALGRLDGDDQRAEALLEVVARADRAGRAGRGDERAQAQVGLLLAQRLEHALERGAGREVVGDVVPELRELVEDHVVRVLGQLVAPVVDLLDVALGARCADDVARVDDPLLQPREALAAHPLGQHGDAVAAEQAGDRDAAAAVVAGRRPDGPVGGGVEPARDQARRQAAVGGQHLVGSDQRESVAERDDDPRLDAGQLGRQDEVLRDVDEVGPVRAVVPVHPEQVQRVRDRPGPTPRERLPHRVAGSSVG